MFGGHGLRRKGTPTHHLFVYRTTCIHIRKNQQFILYIYVIFFNRLLLCKKGTLTHQFFVDRTTSIHIHEINTHTHTHTYIYIYICNACLAVTAYVERVPPLINSWYTEPLVSTSAKINNYSIYICILFLPVTAQVGRVPSLVNSL